MATEVRFTRFKGADWFVEKNTFDTIIGGAGGIGSYLAYFLARAGFRVHIFDMDKVEEVNMAGQMYRLSDIGKNKVDAVAEIIKDFCNEEIYTYEEYTEESEVHDFMFSGFDNMKARKIMFNNWANHVTENNIENAIFIDGRLEAEKIQIFCVTKDKIGQYKEYLFDDSAVPDLPCTLKQTSHCASMIASHMVGFFTNYISNMINGNSDRIIPFFTEYIIPLNFLENRNE